MVEIQACCETLIPFSVLAPLWIVWIKSYCIVNHKRYNLKRPTSMWKENLTAGFKIAIYYFVKSEQSMYGTLVTDND